jgi:hypothetical protein
MPRLDFMYDFMMQCLEHNLQVMLTLLGMKLIFVDSLTFQDVFKLFFICCILIDTVSLVCYIPLSLKPLKTLCVFSSYKGFTQFIDVVKACSKLNKLVFSFVLKTISKGLIVCGHESLMMASNLSRKAKGFYFLGKFKAMKYYILLYWKGYSLANILFLPPILVIGLTFHAGSLCNDAFGLVIDGLLAKYFMHQPIVQVGAEMLSDVPRIPVTNQQLAWESVQRIYNRWSEYMPAYLEARKNHSDNCLKLLSFAEFVKCMRLPSVAFPPYPLIVGDSLVSNMPRDVVLTLSLEAFLGLLNPKFCLELFETGQLHNLSPHARLEILDIVRMEQDVYNEYAQHANDSWLNCNQIKMDHDASYPEVMDELNSMELVLFN